MAHQQSTLLTSSLISHLTKIVLIDTMKFCQFTINNLLKLSKSLVTSSSHHLCWIFKLRYLRMDICRLQISCTCFHFQLWIWMTLRVMGWTQDSMEWWWRLTKMKIIRKFWKGIWKDFWIKDSLVKNSRSIQDTISPEFIHGINVKI